MTCANRPTDDGSDRYTPYGCALILDDGRQEMAVRCMLADARQRPTIQQLLPILRQLAEVATKAQRNPDLWNAFEINLDRP